MRRVWTRPQISTLDKIVNLSSLSTLFEKYTSNNIRKEIFKVEENLKDLNLWATTKEEKLKLKELTKQLVSY